MGRIVESNPRLLESYTALFDQVWHDLARHMDKPGALLFLPQPPPEEVWQALRRHPAVIHTFVSGIPCSGDSGLSSMPGYFDPWPVGAPGASALVFYAPEAAVSARIVIQAARQAPLRHVYHYSLLQGWRREPGRLFLARRMLRYVLHKIGSPVAGLLRRWPVAGGVLQGTRLRRAFDRVLRSGPLLPPEAFIPGRILHASCTLGGGGAERQTVATLLGLQARGYGDCGVLCDHLHDQSANGFYLGDLRQRGITAGEIRQAPFDFSISTWEPVLEALGPVLRVVPHGLIDELLLNVLEFHERRPQVVHVWQDKPLAAMAARIVGVPTVLLAWRSLSPAHYPSKDKYLHPACVALAAEGGTRFVCNSTAGRDDYARWLGLPPERIGVLRNGLDPQAWQAATPEEVAVEKRRLGIPEGRPVVGGVFRLVREKDPLLWVRAAAETARLCPEAIFLICGDGDLRPAVERAVAEAGIGDRFLLPGTTTNSRLAVSLFDVFLLTSIIEGTPNVLIEAQMCGVPVVTTDAGGAADTVEEGKTGWVVRDRSPQALAERLALVLRQGEKRTKVANLARSHAVERFGIDRMVDETLMLYGLERRR